MSPDAKLAVIWVTFTLLVWVALVPMLAWAIKTRQFSDQDRARRLALRSGPPRTEVDAAPRPEDDSGGSGSPAALEKKDEHHVSP